MATDEFIKQTSEKFTIQADFSNALDTGETITLASSSVVAEDSNGDDVSDTILVPGSKSVDSQYLKIKVQAGSESYSPYKITFLALTSLSNIYEKDAFMVIIEY